MFFPHLSSGCSLLKFTPHRAKSILAWTLFLLLAAAVPAAAQVSIAPTALFLGEQSRTGTLYISNGTEQAQQVDVEFRFGYPAADSAGNMYMEYEDSTAAEEYSLQPYLRVFPRQFSLPAGESQVVRVVARPLSDRPEGMYWTRLLTTSEPQVESIDTTEGGLRPQVTFRIRQVTSVLYRKGQPSSRINIQRMQASVDTNTVSILADLRREGRAPFLGTARFRLLDEGGTAVLEQNRAVAAYFSMERRFQLELEEALQPGRYTAEMAFTAQRDDVPETFRIPMSPATASTQLTIE